MRQLLLETPGRLQLLLEELQQLVAHVLRPHDEGRFVEVGVEDGQQVVRVGLQQQADEWLGQQRRQQRHERRLVRHQQRQEANHLPRNHVVVAQRLLQLATGRFGERGLFGEVGGGRETEVGGDGGVADGGAATGGVVERGGEAQTLLVQVLLDQLLLRGAVAEEKRQRGAQHGDARAEQQGAEGGLGSELDEEVGDGGVDDGGQRQHEVVRQRVEDLDGAAEPVVERQGLRE